MGEWNVANTRLPAGCAPRKLGSAQDRINAQGEYYLTENVISLMIKMVLKVIPVVCPDVEGTLGINNRIELAEAARILRKRI